MDPGRMSFNDYRSYLKERGEKVTSGEASIRWRDAQAAAGIEYVSPSKKRRERSARVKAARSDELKNNAELAGRVAATRWENMTDEQKNEVKARLDNDVAFADAFVEAIGSVMTLDRSSSDLFDEETGEESKGDAGEESKEEGGEEKSDPSLRRTAPMDDEERNQALISILGNWADRDSLVDDMGLPLGKEQLLTLAKLTPIWGALSDQQKQMFLSENGTFASGRQYVATAKVARKAPIRKTIVQASSGKVMAL